MQNYNIRSFWLSVYMKIGKAFKICTKSYMIKPTQQLKLTWNKTFNFSEIDWKNIDSWPFKITTNSSLQWFQTCINHNILPRNKFLHEIKIIDNPLYSVCSIERETIRHLLWECEYIQTLCHDFKIWCSENNIFF